MLREGRGGEFQEGERWGELEALSHLKRSKHYS